MDYSNKMKSHMNTYNRKKDVFKHGKGVWLYDDCNHKYLDFVSGIATNSLGHSPDIIRDTLIEQSSKLLHISNLYWNIPQLELVDYLVKKSDHKDVFLCNSGTEAVEGALKLSKKFGKQISNTKNKIIYFKNSFHGRSIGALSVTGQKKYQEIVTPLLSNTICINLDNYDEIITNITEDTCAVIMEPIQGEGGLITVSNKTLKLIRDLCNKNNCLLIFDEVQCGIGRTGTFYAYESTPVIPDIICLAKGLGGGLPIGAIVANEKASVFSPGDHASTFGGNPLVSAVSSKVVSTIGDDKFLLEVNNKSKYIKEKLYKLIDKYPIISEIKGKGLLLGVDFKEKRNDIINKLYDKRVLVVGASDKTLRILPPLNVKYDEIDYFFEVFESCLLE